MQVRQNVAFTQFAQVPTQLTQLLLRAYIKGGQEETHVLLK